MKFFRNVLGYMIAGMIVMSVWGPFVQVESFGIIGGWLAAFAIIGPMWFMNHFLGLIYHSEGSSFVDMGLGIALVGIFRDVFLFDGVATFMAAVPTMLLVALGASLGGFAAAKVSADMAKGGKA